MRSPIDWDLAERTAIRAGGTEPLAHSYLYDSLSTDFARATAQATKLVIASTGLSVPHNDVSAVVTRGVWVKANLGAFERVLEPIATRLAERQKSNAIAAVGRRLTGLELGGLIGWMSRRVLGQFDVFARSGGSIYYVGPNVLAIEKRYGFSPDEFRLWIALHEVTHRAQFLGVPWMREYFLGLVDHLVELFDTDPKRFLNTVRHAASAAREDVALPREMGLLGFITSPEQREVIEKLQALMSILEGHADVVMNRAGDDELPNARRFHHVFHARRMSANGFGGALQRLFGFEAKIRQYALGASFIEKIEREGGPETSQRLWESSDLLPSLQELEEPNLWLERVGSTSPAVKTRKRTKRAEQ